MKTNLKSKVNAKLKSILITVLFCPLLSFSQSDVTTIIKGGELLFSGLITILSASKNDTLNSNIIKSVCVKNKLEDKITFVISRQDENGEEIIKELIIQKDSKEYFYELPKGVYTYQVILPNEEVFKKGEYTFTERSTLTINDN